MGYAKNKMFTSRQRRIKENVELVIKDIFDRLDDYQNQTKSKLLFTTGFVCLHGYSGNSLPGNVYYTVSTVNSKEKLEPMDFISYDALDYLHILIGELTLNGFSVELTDRHEEKDDKTGNKVVYETWEARINY